MRKSFTPAFSLCQPLALFGSLLQISNSITSWITDLRSRLRCVSEMRSSPLSTAESFFETRFLGRKFISTFSSLGESGVFCIAGVCNRAERNSMFDSHLVDCFVHLLVRSGRKALIRVSSLTGFLRERRWFGTRGQALCVSVVKFRAVQRYYCL